MTGVVMKQGISLEALRKAEDHNAQIAAAISMINSQWDLCLPMPKPSDSPHHRLVRGQQNKEDFCVSRIKYLQYKGRLSVATHEFRVQAEIKYSKWVDKPKAERGPIPRADRRRRYPISNEERIELLECLSDILGAESRKIPPTPLSERQTAAIDDSPVFSPLFSKLPKPRTQLKRSSDDYFNDITGLKKQKHPGVENSMPPPHTRHNPLNPEISFVSDAPSVFSVPPSFSHLDSNDTQFTIPDDASEISTQPNSPTIRNPPSSDYGSSSFEQHVKKSFCDNPNFLGEAEPVPEEPFLNSSAMDIVATDPVAGELHNRLNHTFPWINSSLESLPFPLLYEITRICLHIGIPMQDMEIFLPPPPVLDYDDVWSWLQKHPLLQGKSFPPRCHKEVWKAAAAMTDFSRGTRAVVFSGVFQYSSPESKNTFYQFRLEPMRFDASYRLGRRHGNDRFFELDIPQLSGMAGNGKKLPGELQKLGEKGQVLLISWFVDGVHNLFGRTWKPFHIKPKERRGRKGDRTGDDFDTDHRLFFFAVDGHDFSVLPNPLRNVHQKMSVADLLDSARPTSENTKEKFLKLFARTDLVVSKNIPTVVLQRSQIIFKDDINNQKKDKDDINNNGKDMTDGAGQISYKLAITVTQKLGLSFIPSGFQGRIGEAKGFWSVNYNDNSGVEWMSIYKSQTKWNPRPIDDREADHESNRTFEVLRYSSPLKAADLNLQFLPLLQDRALDPHSMEMALKDLLQEGLQRQLHDLQKAMVDPQAFRVWLREAMSSAGDRLRNECVQYRAGLPTSMDEKFALFLDAGFDPNKLSFLKELARKAFKAKCDELKKRLNITVSKSSYVYMIPDFAGVLEPNEVYLDFSSFSDESSGFCNTNVLLNGVDVLVARSPAHYVSDIQKVRAVQKVELMGLKDVIVFSTKGLQSLAAKLSGGDYDGDIAWVCWEPAIVDNFMNADVPECPDLVRLGFIEQSSETYEELVKDDPFPTSTFLNASFLFNMQQPMLGICTIFKEHLCYAMGTVNSKEAVYISTLLSLLVDQAKQGYRFTVDHWEIFKSTAIKRKTQIPSYKTDQVLDHRSRHIIVRLMITAEKTIEQMLTEFQKNTTATLNWDDDLVKYYDWARSMAKEKGVASEWHRLIQDLDADIKEMMDDWSAKMSFMKDSDVRDEYLLKVDTTYEAFISIVPHFDSALTQALLPNCLRNENYSDWALLRTSALLARCRRYRKIPAYVWNIAGNQIARLKVRYGGAGLAHSVVPSMYAMLKPDAGYVKRARTQREVREDGSDEISSIVNADEINDFED